MERNIYTYIYIYPLKETGHTPLHLIQRMQWYTLYSMYGKRNILHPVQMRRFRFFLGPCSHQTLTFRDKYIYTFSLGQGYCWCQIDLKFNLFLGRTKLENIQQRAKLAAGIRGGILDKDNICSSEDYGHHKDTWYCRTQCPPGCLCKYLQTWIATDFRLGYLCQPTLKLTSTVHTFGTYQKSYSLCSSSAEYLHNSFCYTCQQHLPQ